MITSWGVMLAVYQIIDRICAHREIMAGKQPPLDTPPEVR
jgi:hypothetical protein